MPPHPLGAAKGHRRGSQVPYSGGGRVPVCPAPSSPAPVGAGALRTCWWWEMWVPSLGSWVLPFFEKRAMGDPLPCCAEDLLGGSHPPPLSSPCPHPPQPMSPLPKTVLRSFSPLSPNWGGGMGLSSCCFPLPLGGLDPSIQTLPAGRLGALGPYLPGYRTG